MDDDGLAYALKKVARAITDDVAPGHDATGGTVASLTEAVMGITAGLTAIAGAIDEHSAAIDRLTEAVHLHAGSQE